MASKVTNLQEARRAKRDKTGWTVAELKERAARRAATNRALEQHEPPNLASGKDMHTVASEQDDEDEDE